MGHCLLGSGFNPSQKIFCQNPIHLSHISKYINHKKKHLWKCTQIFGTFSLQISVTKPVAFQCFAMFLSAPRHDSYIFAWKRFIFSQGSLGTTPVFAVDQKTRHRFCWSKMAAVFGQKGSSNRIRQLQQNPKQPGKKPHGIKLSIWAIYYKSLTQFKAILGGFPYFSPPFGVTSAEIGRYKLPRSM